MKKLLAVSLVAGAMATSPVYAGDVEGCVTAINGVKDGDLVKLEALETNGKDVFSFELVDAEGQEWEFTCDVTTGKIIQQEGEVEAADAEAFAELAKIDEKKATEIVLAKFPGEIEEVEFEIKADGQPVYEFDVEGEGDVETKVEVSAVSGDIIEVSIEKWEIGLEEEERR